jgi:putative transposase
MKIRRSSHGAYQHQYHIVWVTKYRRKYIKPYVKIELSRILFDYIKTQPTLHIETLNTDNDHIHIQMVIPPSLAVSTVVQRLKWISSIKLKKKFKFINQMYLKRQSVWSVGFFSSTVGLNEEMIKRYIQYQGKQEQHTLIKLGSE